MQYTSHYNLNLPEGTDIVNPLVQDNPNYTAIDTALYNNKLRVVGTATHVKTGTNHAITLGDSDINQFKFVATGDYATGDTFTIDGVTVTPRIADGSSIPTGAFKINSIVFCILDGTILNFIGIAGVVSASDVILSNGNTVESEVLKGAIQITADGVKTNTQLLNDLYALIDLTKLSHTSAINYNGVIFRYDFTSGTTANFGMTITTNNFVEGDRIKLSAASEKYYYDASFHDQSSNVPAVGTIIKLFY